MEQCYDGSIWISVNMKTHTKEELVKMIQDIHKRWIYYSQNFNHVNQVKNISNHGVMH